MQTMKKLSIILAVVILILPIHISPTTRPQSVQDLDICKPSNLALSTPPGGRTGSYPDRIFRPRA